VHAVGTAALDEVGAVVQDEERAVGVTQAPERLCRADELIVGELLVPQLHDVDAASERSIEQRRRIPAVRLRLEDEIEARACELRSAVRAVHGGAAYRPV